MNAYYFNQKTEVATQELVKAKLIKQTQRTKSPPQRMSTGHLSRIKNQ